jgi:hypothetical protein
MKKILSLIIIGLSVLSCSEDMLNRYPTTSLVIENFYKTPEDATQAVVAVYNTLLKEDWWSQLFMSEAASDNCAGGAGSGDGGGFQRWDRGLEWPDANTHQDVWKTYYGAIFRANVYLENEVLIDWTGNEALQKQYQAEVRFLRAHFHFYLARLFGEIPALSHTIAPDETPSRTPAEDLYTFIMDDLKFCIDNGLSAPYGVMNPSNWGRVTKWAAEAMAARVYLYYSGYYNDATLGEYTAETVRGYIDDVINNSGHELVPEFASLWRVPTITELGDLGQYAGETNPEVVWAVRYESSGNPYGTWHRMMGPRNTNHDPYGQGWGAITVMPTLWNQYDLADKRKTATIISYDDEGFVYNWSDAAITQAQYTGYSPKKYLFRSVGGNIETSNWQLDGFEDFMVIRFADVLLMGAELHLITGDAGTALTWINRVRRRAFGDDTHNYSSVTLENIFAERKLELACEGLRYWDILRSCKGDFSKLVPILTYVDDTDGDDYSQSIDVVSLDVDGNNFVPIKGLFQIPPGEIALMLGSIEQNPGFNY